MSTSAERRAAGQTPAQSSGTAQVRFAFGGTDYEIHLNKKNAATFRKQLAPFIEHDRKAGRAISPAEAYHRQPSARR
jgi:hypothetical protein